MSTDVAAPAPSPTPAPARRRPSLLAAEALRLSRRRLVHVLLALGAVLFLVVAGLATTQYGDPSDAEVAEAERFIRDDIAFIVDERQTCVDSVPDGEDVDFACGPVPTETDYDISQYISTTPFTAELAVEGVGVAALGVSAVLFLVGATSIGADWSSRALIASLFWQPRRLRVLGVRAAVLSLLAAVVGVLSQLAWTGVALFLTSRSGEDLPDGFWEEFVGAQGRAVLLGVLVALIGFAVANLVRGTGAALGAAFFYVAIAENVVRAFWGPGQQWLLTNNAYAMVNPQGSTVFWFEMDDTAGVDGTFGGRQVEVVIDNLQGGIAVAIYAAVLLAVGTALFRLRDLH